MVVMTVKEYLMQYMEAGSDIDDRLEEIARLRAKSVAIGVSLNPNKVQSSGDKDPVGSIVAQIVDMEREVGREVAHLRLLKEQVMAVITAIPDHKQRKVLYRRYILGEKWEKIAEEMDASYQWVCVLHTKALKRIKLAVDTN